MADLAGIIEAALAAGREVLAVYSGAFDVSLKADRSPCTMADLRAEAVILDALASIAPDIPVIAEESTAAGRVPDARDLVFLVDPLDGTREFIARNGEFTVNIALVRDGAPVLGVVHAPALGLLFAAGEGGGAFRARVDAGGRMTAPEPIRARRAPETLVTLGSRFHATPETLRWLKGCPAGTLVEQGSSLKFCRLAEGRADFYPRFGPTMEWDTAAGDAILRAAGGIVTGLDGAPLSYNRRKDGDDFANPWFVACGDPDLLARLPPLPEGGPSRSP